MTRPSYVPLRPPTNARTQLTAQLFDDERFLLVPIKKAAPIEGWRVLDLYEGILLEQPFATFGEARDYLFDTYYKE